MFRYILKWTFLLVFSLNCDLRVSASETMEEIVRIDHFSSKKNNNIFHIIYHIKDKIVNAPLEMEDHLKFREQSIWNFQFENIIDPGFENYKFQTPIYV